MCHYKHIDPIRRLFTYSETLLSQHVLQHSLAVLFRTFIETTFLTDSATLPPPWSAKAPLKASLYILTIYTRASVGKLSLKVLMHTSTDSL